jgi:transposase
MRFASFAAAVYDRIAAAAVKHLDETGLRIGGKSSTSAQTQWLHIAATVLLTFYRISPKCAAMPEKLTGIAAHDRWKPYYTLEGIRHALCNTHHLRELKALVEIGPRVPRGATRARAHQAAPSQQAKAKRVAASRAGSAIICCCV